jgi:hypothetical protein
MERCERVYDSDPRINEIGDHYVDKRGTKAVLVTVLTNGRREHWRFCSWEHAAATLLERGSRRYPKPDQA